MISQLRWCQARLMQRAIHRAQPGKTPTGSIGSISILPPYQRSFSSSPTSNETLNSGVNPEITSAFLSGNEADTAAHSLSELGNGLGDLTIRMLDFVHTTTGLPWWATIIASTVVVRGLLVYPSIQGIRNAARLKLVQPKLQKLKDDLNNTPQTPESIAKFQKGYRELMKQNDVSLLRGMYTPVLQIPAFLGFFWGLQEIVKYCPDYKTGGALWFTDLTAPDATYTLPVMNAALLVLATEFSADSVSDDMRNKLKIGMRCFSVLMVPLTMHFDSGLFLFWVTSSFLSVAQTAILRIPQVKRALRIPESDPQRQNFVISQAQSPFQIAAARAKQGMVIPTYVTKPPKKKDDTAKE